MLLEDLLKEFRFNCECRRLSAKTVENYEKQILYLIRFLKEEYQVTELEAVKTNQLKSFMMLKYEAGCKPGYINDLLKAFKVFFRYAVDEGYTKILVTEKVKNMKHPKTVIRTFDKSEIRRMLGCYHDNDFQSIRNKTILILFFDTGIRLNELIQLKDSDIHSDYLLIHGKGDKERIVPKSAVVSKWLEKYRRVRNHYFESDMFESVFVSRYKHQLSKSIIEKIVKDAGKYAEVRSDIRISPHTLRHTFCQQQLKNGLDIYSLSRIMGHESISITQRYLEGIRDKDILDTAKNTSTIMNL